MKNKKILIVFFLLMMPFLLVAQQTANEHVEMADVMRSNGKIFVVVTVVTIIMTGLIIYLISLDRKLARLEKRISVKNQS
jgi:CcmD family protein